MIIWLSGPTGAGKTSIAHSLSSCGFAIVRETIPNDLFQSFAANPIVNCEALQRQIMSARLNGWRAVANNARIVFDRSIDEDIEVFCRMHKAAGLLTESQFDALAQLASDLTKQIPQPDLIIFITAGPENLLSRLRASGAPALIVDSLAEQITLYSRWLDNRPEQVLSLDTSRVGQRTMAQLIMEIGSC